MAKLVPVEPFDLVIVGGTGDLAMRKLLPALYHRERDGQVTNDSRIIAASRGNLSRDDYLASVREALEKNLADGELTEDLMHDLEAEIQKLTDKHVKEIDGHVASKETEITTV